MKYFLIIVLALSSWNDPVKISKINHAKAEAKKAFNSGNYKSAIHQYKYLVDSLGVKEDEVLMNLAHAHYLDKDTASASGIYQSLTASTKKEVNSKAHQQLGVMANKQGKFEEALNYFKQALKANPANEDARYNYEMLKKKLDEKKKQEEQKQDPQNKDKQNKDQQKKDEQNKDQQKKDEQTKDEQKKDEQSKDQQKKDEQNKDQQKKDEQNKDQQQKEQEKKEQEKIDQQQQEQDKKNQQKNEMANFDPNKSPDMTPEQLRMILEAMRQQEKQYLQQQRRKATKSRDRSKPDW